MTKEERYEVLRLRREGKSYGEISEALNVPKNTVKVYCNRHGLTDDVKVCKQCGKPLTECKFKERIFCSDACKVKWHNNHKTGRKKHVCPVCSKEFTAYPGDGRKYCSLECYRFDRFKGGKDAEAI